MTPWRFGSPGRGLPCRTARAAHRGRVHRRFNPDPLAETRRAVRDSQRTDHRRGHRPDPGSHWRPAPIDAAVPPDQRLIFTKWRDPGNNPQLNLFGQLKRVTRQWLDNHLVCEGGTYPAQLMYQELADLACERVTTGIVTRFAGETPIKAVLDPYNPTGSTRHVSFNTSKQTRWQTDPRQCHVNWAVCDSDWEAEFCRIAEKHPLIRSYVKNQGLGLEVPYRSGSELRRYIPDFIVRVDDGRGEDDLLNVVVEIKGYRGEDAKDKKLTMDTYWVPGVNNLGTHGRWTFRELTQLYLMEEEFEKAFNELIDEAANSAG